MKKKDILIILFILLAVLATAFSQELSPIKGENAYTFTDNGQNYICLPRQRVAAIGDSIAYYRKYQFVALQCDSILQGQKALTDNFNRQLALKDVQIAKVTQAFELQSQQSKAWEQSATDYKKSYDEIVPKLEKSRRKTRAGWTAFIVTAGVSAVAITTTVLILK